MTNSTSTYPVNEEQVEKRQKLTLPTAETAKWINNQTNVCHCEANERPTWEYNTATTKIFEDTMYNTMAAIEDR